MFYFCENLNFVFLGSSRIIFKFRFLFVLQISLFIIVKVYGGPPGGGNDGSLTTIFCVDELSLNGGDDIPIQIKIYMFQTNSTQIYFVF